MIAVYWFRNDTGTNVGELERAPDDQGSGPSVQTVVKQAASALDDRVVDRSGGPAQAGPQLARSRRSVFLPSWPLSSGAGVEDAIARRQAGYRPARHLLAASLERLRSKAATSAIHRNDSTATKRSPPARAVIARSQVGDVARRRLKPDPRRPASAAAVRSPARGRASSFSTGPMIRAGVDRRQLLGRAALAWSGGALASSSSARRASGVVGIRSSPSASGRPAPALPLPVIAATEEATTTRSTRRGLPSGRRVPSRPARSSSSGSFSWAGGNGGRRGGRSHRRTASQRRRRDRRGQHGRRSPA